LKALKEFFSVRASAGAEMVVEVGGGYCRGYCGVPKTSASAPAPLAAEEEVGADAAEAVVVVALALALEASSFEEEALV
jgi:hypothetical protein